MNPVTNEDQIIDISDTRGDGFYGYDNGMKDISEYDYIRLVVTSPNELNMQTYNGNEQLRTAAFPGAYITSADASRQIVKWTSDNEDIATVDFASVVTAKEGAKGSATITATATATDGSVVTGSVLINVKNPSQTTVVKNHKFDLASDEGHYACKKLSH